MAIRITVWIGLHDCFPDSSLWEIRKVVNGHSIILIRQTVALVRRSFILGLHWSNASSLKCNKREDKKPASADRTARRQFQATGQPVSRTQASDAMTSRLPRYEAKCVRTQRRCFQCGSVPLRSDIKGTELPPAVPIYWYHSKGNWLRYNFAADSFYIMKLCSRLLVLYCWNLYERRQI